MSFVESLKKTNAKTGNLSGGGGGGVVPETPQDLLACYVGCNTVFSDLHMMVGRNCLTPTRKINDALVKMLMNYYNKKAKHHLHKPDKIKALANFAITANLKYFGVNKSYTIREVADICDIKTMTFNDNYKSLFHDFYSLIEMGLYKVEKRGQSKRF